MNDDRDEDRIKIDLDAETALDALLKVDPRAMVDPEPNPDLCTHVWQGQRCILKAGHFEPHLYRL